MGRIKNSGGCTVFGKKFGYYTELMAEYDSYPKEYRDLLKDAPANIIFTDASQITSSNFPFFKDYIMNEAFNEGIRLTYGESHPQYRNDLA